VLAAGAAFISFYETSAKQQVERDAERDLRQLLTQGRTILTDDLTSFLGDLSFLHATPPISGLTRADENGGIDPFDGTSLEQWKLRLETIFIAMLQNDPAIDQLRIIRANEAGSEFIRVDKKAGRVAAVADAMLQDKGTSGYFAEASVLEPEELYVSRMNLNREFGRVEFPIRPTLRLALPIFSEQGTRFGFLIMNINTSGLLSKLDQLNNEPFEIILTDDEGYYIYHPEEEYRFSRDLMPERNWAEDYISNVPNQVTRNSATVSEDNNALRFQQTKIQYASNPASSMSLYATVPEVSISEEIWNRRVTTYGFSLVVVTIMAVTLLMVSRSYRNSIRLADTRAEHEAIIKSSSDGIIGLKLNGQVTSLNDAAEMLLRITRGETVGKHINDVALFPEIDFDKKIRDIELAKAAISFDTMLSTKDEVSRELAVVCSPIISEGRGITGISVIARDVTQERVADRKIRRANTELEEQVARRTEELADAHKKALQASEMKSAFISNVSHEMRTPLNGMVGAHRLIQREALSETQRKYLAMAETSCSTLTTLINDILDLSKIEAGKLEFETKPFNPLALVEAVANSSAIRSREKGIDLVLDTTDLLHIELYGDAGRLKQVLNNLLSNAIKFTEDGFVSIATASRIENASVRLDVSVEDSGIGISDENKHKLFAAFSQEDSSISSEFGGTGLGLSICRQLCEMMGGEISFESTKGIGSRFYFHVYFDAARSKPRIVPQVLEGQHVLVIMAHERNGQVAERIVKNLGGVVTDLLTATDSNKRTPDLVITDRKAVRLRELCAITATMPSKTEPLPKLFVVQNFEREAPDYEGSLEWLSEPLTASEIVVKLRAEAGDTSPVVIPPVESSSGHKKDETRSPNPRLYARVPTVLVVDDNAINLEVAKGLLADIELKISTASSGADALDVIRDLTEKGETVHTILMDCQMPVMDGFETTRHIRNGTLGAAYSAIPIVAMTANAMSGEKEKCLAAGMSDYITKPIDPEILINKVLHWTQKRLSDLQPSS
jgi:PAS domain S-box-containing protein